MSKFPLKHFFNHTRANCFIFPLLIEFKSEIAKDIKYKKYLSEQKRIVRILYFDHQFILHILYTGCNINEAEKIKDILILTRK